MLSLFERWYKGKFAEVKNALVGKPDDPAYFRNSVHIGITQLLQSIEVELGRQLPADQHPILQRYFEGLSQNAAGRNADKRFTALLESISRYDRAHGSYKRLADARREENWANTWDHLKVLVYRGASAVLIAATVLCVGYIADKAQIPLPMLRIP